jgi:hypothetical protein
LKRLGRAREGFGVLEMALEGSGGLGRARLGLGEEPRGKEGFERV